MIACVSLLSQPRAGSGAQSCPLGRFGAVAVVVCHDRHSSPGTARLRALGSVCGGGSGLDGMRDFTSAKEKVLVNAFHRGSVLL